MKENSPGYALITKHGTEVHLDPGPEGIRKKLDEVLAKEIPQ